MATAENSGPAGTVILEAFDESRNSVLREAIPVGDYYSESHPMIDVNEFRSARGIRFIHGRIFDYDGKLDQEFNNEYDEAGVYLRSRIVHADGTVVED